MKYDDLSINQKAKLRIYADNVLNRFVKHYPDKNHCLTLEDICKRIYKLEYCEITGIKFKKQMFYPICINPFDDIIVGINQIAFVARPFRTQYFKICNHISENIKSPEMKTYIQSDMRFKLAEKLTLAKLADQSLEFGQPLILSELIEKSKIKSSREIMLSNIKSPVINNLIEKSKKSITYQSHAKKTPEDEFSERLIRHKIQRCIRTSRRKGLLADITFENSTHIFHRRYCQLTGMKLQKCGHTKDSQMPNTFTIDRVNRFEGYNVCNIIVLCYEANQIKAQLEKFNYSEDLDKIIEILEDVKKRIHNKYKGQFKFKRTLPVKDILEHYINSKNQNKKRCDFKLLKL